jgi:hypothetical protein
MLSFSAKPQVHPLEQTLLAISIEGTPIFSGLPPQLTGRADALRQMTELAEDALWSLQERDRINARLLQDENPDMKPLHSSHSRTTDTTAA